MRRLALSISVLAISGAYVAWYAAAREDGAAPLLQRLSFGLAPGEASRRDPLGDDLGLPPPQSLPAKTPGASPALHDGTFTGYLVDAYYGLMQVAITVSGGSVTAIDPVHYPLSRDVSRQISYYVLPILQTEVVQGHRTDVDMISGATLTVTAYRMSLSDALRQASAGG